MASAKRSQPRLLGYMDIFSVVRTYKVVRDENLVTNPLLRYTDATPDRNDSWWYKVLAGLFAYPLWLSFINRGLLWGVNDADSILLWAPPPSEPPRRRSLLAILLDGVLGRLNGFWSRQRSVEQTRRMQECGRKLQAATKGCFGDRLQDMHEVGSILTAPAKRGRGYASALIQVMAVEADKEGRAIWLANSNIAANTKFYNALGFVTAKTFLVGEDNDAWTEEPVQVAIMVREPDLGSLAEKED